MKFRSIVVIVTIAAFLLTACTGQNPSQAPTAKPSSQSEPAKSEPTTVPTQEMVATQEVEVPADLTKSDAQGAVTMEITPTNLKNPGDAVIFVVLMDTHSVDLSMDLAQLAVLSTDTGKTVQATLWDAPRGGHHVEGKLSFPSTKDGSDLLDGAKSVTITITNVDAPTRTFTWSISGVSGG
ncbi:MAG TPA: hypothetical protein PKD55_23245 [Bellilinea sp.]|nr:hypothetical protein [Bellilinea sp.]